MYRLSRKSFMKLSILGGASALVPSTAAQELSAKSERIKVISLRAVPIAGMTLVQAIGDNGVTGYGEPSPMLRREAMVSMINENIAPLLIGKFVNDMEKLWDTMFTQLYKIGPQGYVNLAMSGVDIALFDLLGKSIGVPVHQLLGGKFRDRVKVYASSLSRDDIPEFNAEKAIRFMEAGYPHTKLKMGVRWGRNDKPKYGEIETVKAISDAIGTGKLAVDSNAAYTADQAILMAEKLKEYDVLFFEEPVPPFDLEGLAEVTRRSPIPISTGESAQTKYQFRDLITHKSAHILQPDVQKCGGLLEAKKIAALAEAWNLPIIVHSTQVPMGALATLHFTCTTPMCMNPQEFACGDPPVREIRGKEGIQVVETLRLEDSSFAPPSVPGIGYEIDEKWLEAKREDR